MEDGKIRSLAARDRAMECLKTIKPDLKRILKEGPSGENDIKKVQMCVVFTIGEIASHEAEFDEISENWQE